MSTKRQKSFTNKIENETFNKLINLKNLYIFIYNYDLYTIAAETCVAYKTCAYNTLGKNELLSGNNVIYYVLQYTVIFLCYNHIYYFSSKNFYYNLFIDFFNYY